MLFSVFRKLLGRVGLMFLTFSCRPSQNQGENTESQSIGSLYQGGNDLKNSHNFPSFKSLSLLYLDFGMCPSQQGIGPSAEKLNNLILKIPQDYRTKAMETIKDNVFNFESYLDEQAQYLDDILKSFETNDENRLKRLLEEDSDQLLHVFGILDNVEHFGSANVLKEDALARAIQKIRTGDIQLKFFDGLVLGFLSIFSPGVRDGRDKLDRAILKAKETSNKLLSECFSPHLKTMKEKITLRKMSLLTERDALVQAQLDFAKSNSNAFKKANRDAYRDVMYTISVLKKVTAYKLYNGKYSGVNTEVPGLACGGGGGGGFVGFWLDFMVNSYGSTRQNAGGNHNSTTNQMAQTTGLSEDGIRAAAVESRTRMTQCLRRYSENYGGFL